MNILHYFQVLREDFEAKEKFVDQYPLFSDWPIKWRKTLAMSFMKQELQYDDALFKQGDEANNMFFVIRLVILRKALEMKLVEICSVKAVSKLDYFST